MDIAAFVIACLGFFIATLSAAWQYMAWHLDGARVRASLMHGVVGRGGIAVGVIERAGRLRDLSMMRAQGWHGPDVLGIEITNTGRSRAKVTRFGLQLERGGMGAAYVDGIAGSPTLPHWIEPGESVTWYADLQDGLALVKATRNTVDPKADGIYMYAELGTGKKVRTRRSIKI